jgi:hypothetical protein
MKTPLITLLYHREPSAATLRKMKNKLVFLRDKTKNNTKTKNKEQHHQEQYQEQQEQIFIIKPKPKSFLLFIITFIIKIITKQTKNMNHTDPESMKITNP